MAIAYCLFHLRSISWEQIDVIQPSFAYSLMVTKSKLELLHINIYTSRNLCLWGCILFSQLSVCPSIHYIVVYEQGVSNKHCLLTFLVNFWEELECQNLLIGTLILWTSVWILPSFAAIHRWDRPKSIRFYHDTIPRSEGKLHCLCFT